MATTPTIPQDLMRGAILHFDNGVPIVDLDVRREHKDRLTRVHHVYFQWVKDPYLDTFQLFKQLLRQGEKQYADRICIHHAAEKDQRLLEFVIDHVAPPSRRVDEARVRAAANQAIRIGLETDNVMALTKGGKLLMDVAHLDQPESEQADMNKISFLPPIVVTDVSKMDDSKVEYNDDEVKRIMAKYGGVIDEKMRNMDEMVEVMEARSQVNNAETGEENE